MKKEKNKFVFANGDSMNPVFSIDGTKLFNTEDVERKIEELEDEIRVTRGNANIVYALNSFYERDIKKQKYKRCLAMAKSCKECAEMYGCMAFHEKLGFGKTPIYKAYKLHSNINMSHRKKWLELAEKFK